MLLFYSIFRGTLDISHPETKEKCTFTYDWEVGKSFTLSYPDKKITAQTDPSFNDPFQASFEVRGGEVVISNPEQGQVRNAAAKECFKKDGTQLTFLLTAQLDPKPKDQECGIQLEMVSLRSFDIISRFRKASTSIAN